MKPARVEYTENYRIGVSDLDQQHARFFEIYNGLADRLAKDERITEAEVSAIFNELFMYTKYHFREEEWIMKTAEYPDLRDHLDQHQSLIDGLAKMRRDAASLLEIIGAIEAFVTIWAEHIIVMDSKLGKFLQK